MFVPQGTVRRPVDWCRNWMSVLYFITGISHHLFQILFQACKKVANDLVGLTNKQQLADLDLVLTQQKKIVNIKVA